MNEFLFLIISLACSSALIYTYYANQNSQKKIDLKKSLIERSKFVLVKEGRYGEYIEVIPLPEKSFTTKFNFNEYVQPNLNIYQNYCLELHKWNYKLSDIEIPQESHPNYLIWQDIGELLRRMNKIDDTILNFQNKIKEIDAMKPIAEASNIYRKYLQEYDKLTLKLKGEIKKGNKLKEETHQLVRENLIGMKLHEFDSVGIINEVDSAQYEYRESQYNLESKYSSLILDMDIYLDTIDEYSKLLESIKV